MDTIRIYDPREFLEKALSFLEAYEAGNLLALGILFRLAQTNSNPLGTEAPLLFYVQESSRVQAVCVMTPPHRLVLSCSDSVDPSAVDAICEYLRENRIKIPGVVGPTVATERFAADWTETVGCRKIVNMNQMLHRLDVVKDIDSASGHLVMAGAEQNSLVASWLHEFSQTTPEVMTRKQAETAADEAIGQSRVYIWIATQPVSMVAWTRPARHGVAVTWVYTPALYRRHGYATSAVAALTRLLLRKGYNFCTLYTDLANPTANSIYRKIGYVPIQESIVYDFQQA